MDGCWDIATANFGPFTVEDPCGQVANSVSILLGDCTGNFVPPLPRDLVVQRAPEGVLSSDFDGDNIPDLIALNFCSGSISKLKGLGGGLFAPAQHVQLSPGAFPAFGAVEDFNNDQRLDFAVANWFPNDDISVFLGTF
ncbi:MAG: VCBS repeat-containing protein [Acidobacteria bacterium]|nr:VCBS repeat-containing protein [Acidobacteriota bacterium]